MNRKRRQLPKTCAPAIDPTDTGTTTTVTVTGQRKPKNRKTHPGIPDHSSHKLPPSTTTFKRWVLDSAWEQVVKGRPVFSEVEDRLNDHPGIHGQLRFDVLVYGLLLCALDSQNLFLRKAWIILRNLPTRTQRELGVIDHDGNRISYFQVTHRFKRAKEVIETIDKTMKGKDDQAVAAWIVEALIRNSIPDDMPPITKVVALDSTDIATWGRTSFKRNNKGKWKPHSVTDRDARAGHRPNRNGLAAGVFVGYDLHYFTDAIDSPTDPMRPRFIRSLALAPANSAKGKVTLGATQRLKEQTDFEVLAADRGYSLLKPTNWANHISTMKLAKLIDLVILDPRKNRIRGIYDGALLIDGRPFSPALPDELRYLPAFHRDMTEEERFALAARYDQRDQYGFVLSRIDNGKTRWVAPCRKGKVRCPLVPASLRKPLNRDTVHETMHPDRDNMPLCCDQTTITIPEAAFEGKLQLHAYGTTKWLNAYYQRNQVESANANLRTHRYNFQRGTIRLKGSYAHAIMLAIITVALNIKAALEWRSRTNMPQPHPDPEVEADRQHLAALKLAKANKAAAKTKAAHRYRTRKHKPKTPAPDPATGDTNAN